MNKTISGIYRIVCIENERHYYGSSQDINNRWKNHKWELRNNCHTNLHMQNAWNKYGECLFRLEIVELIPKNELLEAEQLYLDEHVGKSNCFNIAIDSTAPFAGRTHSVEAREKMRGPKRGENNPAKRLDVRKKISEAHKGMCYSKETRRKLSESLMGNQNAKGYKHSEETKQKMSKSRKGKPWSAARRTAQEMRI